MLGLSHTTPSVAWVHTYIYILTYSHMLHSSYLCTFTIHMLTIMVTLTHMPTYTYSAHIL